MHLRQLRKSDMAESREKGEPMLQSRQNTYTKSDASKCSCDCVLPVVLSTQYYWQDTITAALNAEGQNMKPCHDIEVTLNTDSNAMTSDQIRTEPTENSLRPNSISDPQVKGSARSKGCNRDTGVTAASDSILSTLRYADSERYATMNELGSFHTSTPTQENSKMHHKSRFFIIQHVIEGQPPNNNGFLY